MMRVRLSEDQDASMTNPTFQLLDIVGTSGVSSDDAIQNGLRKISGATRRIDWFEVTGTRGLFSDGAVKQYQVSLRVGILIDQVTPKAKDPTPF